MHLQQNKSIRHLTELFPRPLPPLVPGCRRATSHNSYIHKRRPNVKLQKRRAQADEVGSLLSWCMLRLLEKCSSRQLFWHDAGKVSAQAWQASSGTPRIRGKL